MVVSSVVTTVRRGARKGAVALSEVHGPPESDRNGDCSRLQESGPARRHYRDAHTRGQGHVLETIPGGLACARFSRGARVAVSGVAPDEQHGGDRDRRCGVAGVGSSGQDQLGWWLWRTIKSALWSPDWRGHTGPAERSSSARRSWPRARTSQRLWTGSSRVGASRRPSSAPRPAGSTPTGSMRAGVSRRRRCGSCCRPAPWPHKPPQGRPCACWSSLWPPWGRLRGGRVGPAGWRGGAVREEAGPGYGVEGAGAEVCYRCTHPVNDRLELMRWQPMQSRPTRSSRFPRRLVRSGLSPTCTPSARRLRTLSVSAIRFRCGFTPSRLRPGSTRRGSHATTAIALRCSARIALRAAACSTSARSMASTASSRRSAVRGGL